MNPRQQTIDLWQAITPYPFAADEWLCLTHGLIISAPDCYAMAMPCHSCMTDDEIIHHQHHTRRPCQLPSIPDTLHIVCLTGHSQIYAHYLKPYRYIAFQRYGGRLRRYPTSRFIKLFYPHERT